MVDGARAELRLAGSYPRNFVRTIVVGRAATPSDRAANKEAAGCSSADSAGSSAGRNSGTIAIRTPSKSAAAKRSAAQWRCSVNCPYFATPRSDPSKRSIGSTRAAAAVVAATAVFVPSASVAVASRGAVDSKDSRWLSRTVAHLIVSEPVGCSWEPEGN